MAIIVVLMGISSGLMAQGLVCRDGYRATEFKLEKVDGGFEFSGKFSLNQDSLIGHRLEPGHYELKPVVVDCKVSPTHPYVHQCRNLRGLQPEEITLVQTETGDEIALLAYLIEFDLLEETTQFIASTSLDRVAGLRLITPKQIIEKSVKFSDRVDAFMGCLKVP